MRDLVRPVEFDFEGVYGEEEDQIILEGLVFKAGDYPDKDFSITPDEIKAAIQNFTPQDVDDSHNERSIFKGKMGKVIQVYTPDNGQTMHAKVTLPKWVDKAMGDMRRTVSCTWDKYSKTLSGLALTTNPRIKEAELYAAFMEEQQEKAEFEGKRNNAKDHKTIQDIHDACMSLGARCSGENADFSSNPPTTDNKELNTMSEENKVEFKDSPEYQALKAQLDAQKAQFEAAGAEIERMKAEKRHSDAVNTVEALLREGKAVPAERPALIAAFEMAATDDAKHGGSVKFDNGQEVSRVEALKAVYAARPAHVLFGEEVPVGASVLFNRETPDPNKVSQDRIKELLAQSELGLSVLEDTRGK